MNQLVTFATAIKAAFRLTIQGKQPTEIISFLLTGHGDEKSVELQLGEYIVDALNIGSGESYCFRLSVDTTVNNEVQYVGHRSSVSTAWRSVSRDDNVQQTWNGATASALDLPRGLATAKFKMRGPEQGDWRSFSGSYLTALSHPESIKVVRSKNWVDFPVVRCDLVDASTREWHCFIPLFSGGTLIHADRSGNGLISIRPNEPKYEALVGSLGNSHRGEASQIVQWVTGGIMADAVRVIQQSRDDPWAAVAAGLLLIGTGNTKFLGPYVQRLAQRNNWMGDAFVVAAWWQASQSNEEGCLMHIVNARLAGQIYYWNTFSLSEQLLSALGSSAKSAETQTEARKELGRWKNLRSGATNVGAFVAWISDNA